jgi:hypothetical protein
MNDNRLTSGDDNSKVGTIKVFVYSRPSVQTFCSYDVSALKPFAHTTSLPLNPKPQPLKPKSGTRHPM